MTTAIRMTIQVNGEPIEGEGRAERDSGFIECLTFSDGITTDQAPTGRSLGRRHYEPIVLRKQIDSTSPQLLSALSQNQQVDAEFRFFRPTSEFGLEHYFTVSITGARIISIERVWSASSHDEYEEVAIAPLAVTWTYEPSGVSFESRPRGVV